MQKKTGGFTLLEVMIAMSILAVGLVAVFQMQSQSVSLASESRFRTTAAFLAQSKMAEIETASRLENRAQSGDFAPDYPEYGWQLSVMDTQMAGLKRIEVGVFNKLYPGAGSYQLIFYRMDGM